MATVPLSRSQLFGPSALSAGSSLIAPSKSESVPSVSRKRPRDPVGSRKVLNCDHLTAGGLTCLYVADRPSKILQHKAFKHKVSGSMQKCSSCDAVLASSSAMKQHRILRHKDPLLMLSCSEAGCESTLFRGKSFLDSHVAEQHDQSLKRHACPVLSCALKFSTKVKLKVHVIASHKDELDIAPASRCAISGCDYVTAHAFSLKVHEAQVHGYEKPYSCGVLCYQLTSLDRELACAQSFKSRAALRSHKAYVHDIHAKYDCDVCAVFKGKDSAQLRRHKVKCAQPSQEDEEEHSNDDSEL